MDMGVPVVTEGGGGLGDDAPPAAPATGSRVRTAKAPPLFARLIVEAIRDPSRGNRRSLRSISADLGIDHSTVCGWLVADHDFMLEYEAARRERYDDLAEECLLIADDKSRDDIIGDDGFRRPNKEWIARSRVRIQTRLDLLARWDPKRYGAKLQVDADVRTRSLNVNFDGGDVDAAHRYADMMRGRPVGESG